MAEPTLLDPEERLQEAVLAYLKAGDSGEAVDCRTLLERYADIATQLQAFFDDELKLAPLLSPLQSRGPMDGSVLPAVRTFGRYELLAELGRGGMGIVYKARQPGLNRLVALKILRSGTLATAADLERFRNETQATAGLEHPHIVPIYDVGEHEGQLYYTMPLMEGGSLAEWQGALHDGSRSISPVVHDRPRNAATLVATIARAVHHAHQHGVLHRDIKPSNVLLDGTGRPFIADFGLAKRLDSEQSLTETGALVGTPAFMSPEQALGRGREVTTASDVYGLGAILYTLLAGKPPFRGATVLETLASVRERDADPVSSHNPLVDGDLSAICQKCLEKSPQARYPSADALADDLDRWRTGIPVQARAVGRLGRAWRWCRRNRLVAGMGTAIALLITTGIVILSAGYVVVREARDEAREQADYLLKRVYSADIRQAYGLWQRGNNTDCQALLARYVPAARHEDLRGVEWHYLQRLADWHPREITCYRGQRGTIFHATFSPNGTLVASGGEARDIHLWDPQTGESRGIIQASPENPDGHTQDVNWLAFSPDGQRLASAGDEGVIRLWDTKSLASLGVLQGHAGPVECIDFTPDGSKLVSAGADGTVRIWNAPTCTLSQEWRAHDGNIESLDISPDGNAIVTGSFDGTVRAWSTQDGTLHWTWGPTWLVRGVAFSPDGRQVAVVETHGAVALLDAHAGALLQMLARHAGTGRGVCFAPSGQWLATCADDQMLQMFSAANGESWGRFLAHDHKFWSVAASPDSRRLVTTSSDQTAKVWEMPARYPTRVIRETRGSLPNVAFALDGTALAVGFTSGGIDRHQIAVFDQLGRRSIQADDDLLTSHIAWTSSQDLCYARKDGSLVLWDRRTGASRVLRGPLDPPAEGWHPGGAVIALAYTHLTRTLCAAYSDGTLRFCDLERSNDQVIGRNSHRWIRRIAPSGDQTIAIARENSVRFWDARLKEWMPDTVAIPEPNRLAALAVARDGQRLAVGLTSGGILLVDRRTSQTQARLYGHQASIDCLAFSPDGKTLASGSADGTVRFWHVPTAQELFVLHDRQMSGGIYSLGFSPDGACLAMGGAPLRDGNSVVLYGDPAPEIRD